MVSQIIPIDQSLRSKDGAARAGHPCALQVSITIEASQVRSRIRLAAYVLCRVLTVPSRPLRMPSPQDARLTLSTGLESISAALADNDQFKRAAERMISELKNTPAA